MLCYRVMLLNILKEQRTTTNNGPVCDTAKLNVRELSVIDCLKLADFFLVLYKKQCHNQSVTLYVPQCNK